MQISFYFAGLILQPFLSHGRFTTGHIWACPPSEGDDYIFHCHPVDQKIPKPKRLQEWYKKMLDKAVAERIVHDYKVTIISFVLSDIAQAVPGRNPTAFFYEVIVCMESPPS